MEENTVGMTPSLCSGTAGGLSSRLTGVTGVATEQSHLLVYRMALEAAQEVQYFRKAAARVLNVPVLENEFRDLCPRGFLA